MPTDAWEADVVCAAQRAPPPPAAPCSRLAGRTTSSSAKNLRPQRDRLVQLRRRLEQLSPGDEDTAKVHELTSNLFKVYFIGIEAGARYITTCLELAAENGARIALNPAFAIMPEEQLYDALLAHRLPARPTTQVEAFSRVEATFYVVKLP